MSLIAFPVLWGMSCTAGEIVAVVLGPKWHDAIVPLQVLALMMQGKSNKAICRILNLAEPTVKNHVTAILKALKVTNRTEAVIKVAKASAASMSYTYTISGYSTFLRG